MSGLKDMADLKALEKEYGVRLTPAILPPVSESFESELPQIPETPKAPTPQVYIMPAVPAEFDLDAPEEIEGLTLDELAEVEEDKTKVPDVPRLIETLKGTGYTIKIYAIGKNFDGEVLFNSGTKEKLYGPSLDSMRLALRDIANQGVTSEDLDAEQSFQPSNSLPSVNAL